MARWGGETRLEGAGVIKKFTRLSKRVTGAMNRRLIAYTLILVLVLGVVCVGTVTLFGHFSHVELLAAETLALQLSVFERNVSNYFDFVAAHGIQYSKELTFALEAHLQESEISFGALNGAPDAIEKLENVLYDVSHDALKASDCSGVYYFLNATTNPALPGADRSKCGMYIKVANITTARSADPKLALFRGYTGVKSDHRLNYHNMWALEFDVDVLPFYDTLMASADKNLNTCFLFTDAFGLPNTWEEVMLLCVPIVGGDGTVYGICGFEISRLYFMLRHEPSAALPRASGLLTRRDSDGLFDVTSGFSCGYVTGLNGRFTSNTHAGFTVYTSPYGEFIGLETPIRLSPLEQERLIAIMMPKADYNAQQTDDLKEKAVIFTLLALIAVFGCVAMSKIYVAPILHDLKLAADGQNLGVSRIQEIDDLLLYLKEQDDMKRADLDAELEKARREMDAEMENLSAELEQIRQLEGKERRCTSETEYGTPNLADYERFLESLKSLTAAETSIFNLYMQGRTARQICDELFITNNTVKFHNKNIYKKLGVSSFKALRVYIYMMKEM